MRDWQRYILPEYRADTAAMDRLARGLERDGFGARTTFYRFADSDLFLASTWRLDAGQLKDVQTYLEALSEVAEVWAGEYALESYELVEAGEQGFDHVPEAWLSHFLVFAGFDLGRSHYLLQRNLTPWFVGKRFLEAMVYDIRLTSLRRKVPDEWDDSSPVQLSIEGYNRYSSYRGVEPEGLTRMHWLYYALTKLRSHLGTTAIRRQVGVDPWP